RRREGHRGGAVDDEVDAEVLFFLVEAHEELTEPLIDPHVEVADVVPLDVVPVIGELDAAAALLAAPLRSLPPRHDPPAHDRQGFEPAQELLTPEILLHGTTRRPRAWCPAPRTAARPPDASARASARPLARGGRGHAPGAGLEQTVEESHRIAAPCAQSAVSGSSARISSMTASVVMDSASPSKFRSTRCRKAGAATWRTSS